MADVVERARYASLIVVSQHDPQDDEEFSADDLIHDLLLGGGRPVLVVPKWPVRGTVGQRAVVAWNNSREASRALADALPLLAGAAQVTVMIAPADRADAIGERLIACLARHEVTATYQILEDHPDKSPGVAILREYNALEANLLVMGGVRPFAVAAKGLRRDDRVHAGGCPPAGADGALRGDQCPL